MREFRAMPRTSKLLGSMRMGHLPKHAGIHAGARVGKGVFAAWLPEACRREKLCDCCETLQNLPN